MNYRIIFVSILTFVSSLSLNDYISPEITANVSYNTEEAVSVDERASNEVTPIYALPLVDCSVPINGSMPVCTAGGEGASSCMYAWASQGGGSCSVTCRDGYYACCGWQNCSCEKEEGSPGESS